MFYEAQLERGIMVCSSVKVRWYIFWFRQEIIYWAGGGAGGGDGRRREEGREIRL